MANIAIGRGLFLNRRWCVKCKQPKELRGGKIRHKNQGAKEQFICAGCSRG